jgi:hypothetical protein
MFKNIKYQIDKIQVFALILARIELQRTLTRQNDRLNKPDYHNKFGVKIPTPCLSDQAVCDFLRLNIWKKIQVFALILARIELQRTLTRQNDRLNKPDSHNKFGVKIPTPSLSDQAVCDVLRLNISVKFYCKWIELIALLKSIYSYIIISCT